MQSRIRTIKPEFYTHPELYEAERETGLPLRIAYSGLWCQCDREGRFEWKPQQLKLHILPYDAVDFGAVLDALARHGFLIPYEVDGKRYGEVPTFKAHQQINNRESTSKLPPRPVTGAPRVADASVTREAHVDHAPASREAREDDATQGEGKGTGTEQKGTLTATTNTSVEPAGSTAVAAVVSGSPESTAVAKRAQKAQSVEQITTRLGALLEHVGEQAKTRMTAEQVVKLKGEFVFAYWAKQTGHERALYDAKRERYLLARLRENRGDVNELLYVVDGALRSPYHVGQNEQGTKYLGIETIFRDRAQVEKLAALCPKYRQGEPHPLAVKYGATGAIAA